MPFEKWTNGEDLFTQLDRDVDLLDRDVRPWAEECDQMQGLQIYTGGDDAWGGFASKYIEGLRDEFAKLPIWIWGTEEEHGKGQRSQQLQRTLNRARTVNEMSTHGSMYIPLVMPERQLPAYVKLDQTSRWHTSALLSSAVETMTLPSRLRSNQGKRGLLADLEAALNVNGNQKVAQLQCKILDPEFDVLDTTTKENKDDRIPPPGKQSILDKEDSQHVLPNLDMNLSGIELRSSSNTTKRLVSDHVFGAVEEERGTHTATITEDDTDEVLRTKKHRRFTGLPVIER